MWLKYVELIFLGTIPLKNAQPFPDFKPFIKAIWRLMTHLKQTKSLHGKGQTKTCIRTLIHKPSFKTSHGTFSHPTPLRVINNPKISQGTKGGEETFMGIRSSPKISCILNTKAFLTCHAYRIYLHISNPHYHHLLCTNFYPQVLTRNLCRHHNHLTHLILPYYLHNLYPIQIIINNLKLYKMWKYNPLPPMLLLLSQ